MLHGASPDEAASARGPILSRERFDPGFSIKIVFFYSIDEG